MTGIVRKPVAAGRFYPRDPASLSSLLCDLLEASPETEDDRAHDRVSGILVPHAGYPYSGRTAASAFKTVAQTRPARIWLIGPSHYLSFQGIALPEADRFETPIGTSPVADITGELRRLEKFAVLPAAHKNEHSLEVELPFIQVLWGEIPIVPLLVGNENDWGDLERFAATLKPMFAPHDLCIVSNDFTHYGSSFGYAPFSPHQAAAEIRKIDRFGADLICQGRALEFFHYAKKTTFDGGTTIPLAMQLLAPCEAKLLTHRLSGDLNGAYDHSVSYLAMLFRSLQN